MLNENLIIIKIIFYSNNKIIFYIFLVTTHCLPSALLRIISDTARGILFSNYSSR